MRRPPTGLADLLGITRPIIQAPMAGFSMAPLAAGDRHPLQRGLSGPLAPACAERGSPDFLAMWAGQGAALIRDLPAAQLIEALLAETERALA